MGPYSVVRVHVCCDQYKGMCKWILNVEICAI